jgi:hypothetical protein
VAANALRSDVGKRFGSSRSVKEATPAGTSGIAFRRFSAACFARASRLRPVGEAAASIDRDVSSAKNASVSVRR